MNVERLEALLTSQEYLQLELDSLEKHEYIRGRRYAMAGVTDAHERIRINLTIELGTHLRRGPCRLFGPDMKLYVPSADVFYYPDLLVTCDERDRGDPNFKRYPSIILEILSKKTAGFDRGDKFGDYSELDSLREYVLIDSRRRLVERYARNDAGLFVRHDSEGGGELEIDPVNFRMPLDAVYQDVDFSSESDAD